MKRVVVGMSLMLVMAPQSIVAQSDPFAGTWKADVAKSTYTPGPGPMLETLRFEAVGDGFKVSVDGANSKGPYHSEAVGKFDGVDVPVTGAPMPRGVVWTDAFRRIDDHTWDIVIKMNGVTRLLVHNVVSPDGKTMKAVSTVTTDGRINQVVLYEKQ